MTRQSQIDAHEDIEALRKHCTKADVDVYEVLKAIAIARAGQGATMSTTSDRFTKVVTGWLPVVIAAVSVIVFATKASLAADDASKAVSEVRQLAAEAKQIATEANSKVQLIDQSQAEVRRRLEELRQGQEKTNDLLMQLYMQNSQAGAPRRPASTNPTLRPTQEQ